MEDKNQNLEVIEQRIHELKKAVISRFDARAEELRYAQEQGLVQFSAELTVVKNNMLMDLDNRLALIKQFPSVLDADIVQVREINSPSGNTRIEFRTGGWIPEITLDTGKWKVLVLAKRIS